MTQTEDLNKKILPETSFKYIGLISSLVLCSLILLAFYNHPQAMIMLHWI